MVHLSIAGTFTLGDRVVNRLGYGAMQLAGPGVFGPPGPRSGAARGGGERRQPHRYQRLLWAAGHQSHDNLRNLRIYVLDVVNLSLMGDEHASSEGPIAEQFIALAELQRRGLIRHLGLSNATAAQVEQARPIAPVVCVQNHFNVAHREDDALIDNLAGMSIAYVPFFPLGGFSPLQSSTLSHVAARLGASSATLDRCGGYPTTALQLRRLPEAYRNSLRIWLGSPIRSRLDHRHHVHLHNAGRPER
jgi:hypothetical protein